MQDIKIGTLVRGGQNSPKYIEQIAQHGFESYSIFFWHTPGETDLKKLADELQPVLEKSGAVISSLSIYGNPLETKDIDKEAIKSWETLIDNAHLFGTDIVSGFTGRVRGKSIPESIDRFKEVFTPLAERAGSKNVRLAFENCRMSGGTWAQGDWNIAHNPNAWELMFDAVRHENMGLEWEPCHQLVSLIDPLPQLKEWVNRVFHVHGKDATVHWDVINKHGIHSSVAFAENRTPGFGDSNWSDIIIELRRAGFKGSIDIEGWHDPVYKQDLEMTGQVRALNYLKDCRGNDFVPNPVM